MKTNDEDRLLQEVQEFVRVVRDREKFVRIVRGKEEGLKIQNVFNDISNGVGTIVRSYRSKKPRELTAENQQFLKALLKQVRRAYWAFKPKDSSTWEATKLELMDLYGLSAKQFNTLVESIAERRQDVADVLTIVTQALG